MKKVGEVGNDKGRACGQPVLRAGATVAHRSPKFAFGLTRCACQTAVYKKSKKSGGEITKKGCPSQPDQKIDNLAVLPGGI